MGNKPTVKSVNEKVDGLQASIAAMPGQIINAVLSQLGVQQGQTQEVSQQDTLGRAAAAVAGGVQTQVQTQAPVVVPQNITQAISQVQSGTVVPDDERINPRDLDRTISWGNRIYPGIVFNDGTYLASGEGKDFFRSYGDKTIKLKIGGTVKNVSGNAVLSTLEEGHTVRGRTQEYSTLKFLTGSEMPNGWSWPDSPPARRATLKEEVQQRKFRMVRYLATQESEYLAATLKDIFKWPVVQPPVG